MNGAAQTVYQHTGFIKVDRQVLTLAIASPMHII
jgi:hypothetical protein